MRVVSNSNKDYLLLITVVCVALTNTMVLTKTSDRTEKKHFIINHPCRSLFAVVGEKFQSFIHWSISQAAADVLLFQS